MIKTKRNLREAFIRLLLQKRYDAISIQDIVTEAQTARVTFYRHYKDKEQLLVDCVNVNFKELVERMSQITTEDVFNHRYQALLLFYKHIQEKETLYKILFSSWGTRVVIEQFRKLFAEMSKENIAEQFPVDKWRVPIPMDIVAYHFASAQIGTAIWWLENNQPYPPEYMAKVSLWLTLAGGLRLFGEDEFYIPPPSIPEKPE